MAGTKAYMAPEQLLGQKHGVQVDSWQMGCLLMYLRTGLSPFSHLPADLDLPALAARRTYEEVLSCGLFNHLDDVEHAFLKQCLVHDWQQRPTVDQLYQTGYLLKGPLCVQARCRAAAVNSLSDWAQRLAAFGLIRKQ